jgi:hypothetical protein
MRVAYCDDPQQRKKAIMLIFIALSSFSFIPSYIGMQSHSVVDNEILSE